MAIAGVFPGQGSQSVGMMKELSESFSVIQTTFQEASDILGRDLWQMVNDGPEADLNNTENTQPAMLAAGIATWRVWQEQGGCVPVGMAGHSLGEYSALVASGKLAFADAVSLVAERARLMQEAVPEGEGAMAAILGLDDADVIAVCEKAADENTVVSAVNFNSVGQVVIAGNASGIDKAIDIATEAGAKRAIKLAVSVPSHCALMKPAAEKLAQKLSDTEFTPSDISVLHNVDVQNHNTPDDIRSALNQQLYQAVRWVDTVNSLKNDLGADKLVEFGPGKVLFGLNRRIDRKMTAVCITNAASLEKALAFCEE